VTLADGSSAAAPGPAPSADVTFHSSFDDWADVTAARADPRRLLLTRRIRVRGDWRMLLSLPKALP
jgi:hypothetical protein